MRRTARLFAAVLAVVVGVGSLSCDKPEQPSMPSKRLKVVTTLFPLFDFARKIGSDKVEVSLLVPPGVEPHSFEPRPGDIARINDADVFIYTGPYMEPWVDSVLKGIGKRRPLVIDASTSVSLREANGPEVNQHERHEGHRWDPHIWLDFANAGQMVHTIAKGFSAQDPANQGLYLRNADQYAAKLQDLDKRFMQGLANCKHRVILHGGHAAFTYLAARYNLGYQSAYHGSPNAEPSVRDITDIIRSMRQYGISYVFFEELLTPRVAETIANETGAQLLMLHGAHNITKDEMDRGVTFLSIMEQNLQNLRRGLGCQ